MTDLPPPPQRRSSSLGFDELVGVIVAFSVIGTILFFSLRQKNTEFSLKTLTTAPVSPTPVNLLPTNRESETALPTPSPIVSATPTPQATAVTPVTPERILPVAPLVVVPSVTKEQTVPPKSKPATPTKKAVSFPDVPQVFWARPYIEALAARGILSGFENGTFRPNQPVTRAEFAAQLQKAFDQKVVVPAPNYQDVPNNFWGASAIQEATRSGFLRGYPGNVFRPNQRIAKVEALVSLTKGLGLTSKVAPNQVLKTYQDANKIPKYATNVVAIATESGLVVNYPNRQILDPNKSLTRAEAAALTYQGMVQAGKVPAITSEYVVKP